MSDRDRGGIALLCLLAIVLAAAQFPAAGLGSTPDGGGPIGTPPTADAADSGVGSATTVDADGPGGERGPTTKAETTTEAAGSDDPTDASTPTDRPTETTDSERTDTTTDAGAGGNGGFGPLAEAVAVLGGGGLLVLIVLAVLGGGARRNPEAYEALGALGVVLAKTVPRISAGGARLVTGVPRATMRFVVAASRSAPRLVGTLGAAANGLASGIALATRGLASGLGRAAKGLPGGIASGLGSLGASAVGGLLSAPAGLGSVFDDVLSEESPMRGTGRPTDDARAAAAVDPEESEDPPPASVTEAWERMVERASIRNWRTKTPVEIARAAVRAGHRPEPVARLTNLFRRVRYGGNAGPGALSTARAALDEIDEDGGEET